MRCAKKHPARATEMEPFSLDDEQEAFEQDALLFNPEQWGMKRQSDTSEFMFLISAKPSVRAWGLPDCSAA